MAAVLALVSVSLATWSFAGRSGSGEAASPRSPASTTTPAKARPTKASAAVASNVEGITSGCVGEVNLAALEGALRAANLDDMQGPVSPPEAVDRWWADYPAIAAAVIDLQIDWMARVVPLVGSGTANVTREEVGAAVTQFQSEVEADCQSMASRILAGSASAPGATAPSSPVPTTSTPVAAAPNSPLANVDWPSVTHKLDCFRSRAPASGPPGCESGLSAYSSPFCT